MSHHLLLYSHCDEQMVYKIEPMLILDLSARVLPILYLTNRYGSLLRANLLRP